MRDNETADILIFTSTNEHEQSAVSNFFTVDSSTLLKDGDQNQFYRRLVALGDTSIAHISCEKGKSKDRLKTAIQFLKPKIVIAVGIACSLKDDHEIGGGQILLAKQVLNYHDRKDRSGGIIPLSPRPESFGRYMGYIEQIAQFWNSTADNPTVHTGLVITSNLMDDPEVRLKVKNDHKDAIGLEMEGFGIYEACNGICEWLIVKGVSDYGDGKKKEFEAIRQEKAASNSVKFTIEIIKNLCETSFFKKSDSEIAVDPASYERSKFAVPKIVVDQLRNYTEERDKLLEFIDGRTDKGKFCVITGPPGIGKSSVVVLALMQALPSMAGCICLGEWTDNPITLDNILTGIRLFLPSNDRSRLQLNRNSSVPPTDEQWIEQHLSAFGSRTLLIFLNDFEAVLDDEGNFKDEDLRLALKRLTTHSCRISVVISTNIFPTGLWSEQHKQAFVQEIVVNGLDPNDSKELLCGTVGGANQLITNDTILEAIIEWCRNLASGKTKGANPLALNYFRKLLVTKKEPHAVLQSLKDKNPADALDAIALLFHKALDNFEQNILRILAAYGRAVEKSAIEYVLNELGMCTSIDESLAGLEKKSAVTRSLPQLGKGKYSLSEIDRKIALEEMKKNGNGVELKTLSEIAARYFLDMRGKTSNPLEKFDFMVDEYYMLCQAGRYDHACKLVKNIDEHLTPERHHAKIIELHSRLAERLRNSSDRARSRFRIGLARYFQGEFDEATRSLNQAISDFGKTICLDKMEARWYLARCYYSMGKASDALSPVNELQDECAKYKQSTVPNCDRFLDIRQKTQYFHGFILQNVGDFEESLNYLQKADELARLRNLPQAVSHCNNYLAITLRCLGRFEEAENLHSEGMQNAADDSWEDGLNRQEMSKLYVLMGENDRAIDMGQSSIKIAKRDSGGGRVHIWASQWIAIAKCLKGGEKDLEEAANVISDAFERRRLPRQHDTHHDFEYLCSLPAIAPIIFLLQNRHDVRKARESSDLLLDLGYAEQYADYFTALDPTNWRMRQTKLLVLCTYLAVYGWRESDAMKVIDELRVVLTHKGVRLITLKFLELLRPLDLKYPRLSALEDRIRSCG